MDEGLTIYIDGKPVAVTTGAMKPIGLAHHLTEDGTLSHHWTMRCAGMVDFAKEEQLKMLIALLGYYKASADKACVYKDKPRKAKKILKDRYLKIVAGMSAINAMIKEISDDY